MSAALAFVCPPLVCSACESGDHGNPAAHALMRCSCACTLGMIDLHFVLSINKEITRRTAELAIRDRLLTEAAAQHRLSAQYFRAANQTFERALSLEFFAREIA